MPRPQHDDTHEQLLDWEFERGHSDLMADICDAAARAYGCKLPGHECDIDCDYDRWMLREAIKAMSLFKRIHRVDVRNILRAETYLHECEW